MDKDDAFTNMATATLNWFEYWFYVHWVLYTITSFLSITLFLEILIMYLKSKDPKLPSSAVGYSYIELVVIDLFTISHCFMFLHPCFKAAAVTVCRDKLIKKINEKHHLDDDRKQVLIQYLKNKKYGFRISFFCARLRHCIHFDLYWSPGSVAESNWSILSDTVHIVIGELYIVNFRF